MTSMIDLYNIKWYHKLWIVPFCIIGMLIQLPFYLIAAPFKKRD